MSHEFKKKKKKHRWWFRTQECLRPGGKERKVNCKAMPTEPPWCCRGKGSEQFHEEEGIFTVCPPASGCKEQKGRSVWALQGLLGDLPQFGEDPDGEGEQGHRARLMGGSQRGGHVEQQRADSQSHLGGAMSHHFISIFLSISIHEAPHDTQA